MLGKKDFDKLNNLEFASMYANLGSQVTVVKNGALLILREGCDIAAAIPKAQMLSKPQGLLKAVIDAKADRILGAMLFCEESYGTSNLIKPAIGVDPPYQILRDQIYTHPTMTEALNNPFAV